MISNYPRIKHNFYPWFLLIICERAQVANNTIIIFIDIQSNEPETKKE